MPAIRRRPRVEELEPRILYSADFSPVALATPLAPAEHRIVDKAGEFLAGIHSEQTAASPEQVRCEIVFVDSTAPDYQRLVDDIVRHVGEGRELELIRLESSADGIEQISAALSGRRDISAIHIISHGTQGEVQLGGARLNFDSLLQNATQIRGWSDALRSDADLLIYGCEVAQDAAGKSLIDALARLTGADVAASDDVTGASEKGGDWTLEYDTGHIEASIAISADGQAMWSGTLATYSVTNAANSGAGTLRQAILDANGNGGADTIVFNIAGAGVHTINLTSALDTITGPVTIDGTTQGGFSGTPLIQLDGAGAGAASGLSITGGSSTVRGLIISGFTRDGILLNGSSGNVIAGNYIGTNAAGTAAAANATSGSGYAGVRIQDSTDNTIGGTSAADRNVISGNTYVGILVTGASTNNNLIQGNYVGVDVNGNTALSNGFDAISIEDGANATTIGGTSAGARNVLTGNLARGIWTDGTGDVIQGNYIGVGADGTTQIGNYQEGIYIKGSNTTVGGTAAGAGNVITYSGRVGGSINGMTWAGVMLSNVANSGNAIQGNSIYDNTGLGIDLGNSGENDGVTANDVGDADSGANGLQNFPVVASASYSGATLTLNGSLNSVDGISYRIEFFANSSADVSNYGEGRRYLGFTDVSTTGGNAAFINVQLTVAMTPGETVVATATSATGNTSEFGLNRAVSFTNSAPVLSGANNLTTILEDPSSNNGTLVSALISGQVTDADAGALTGIAVTVVDNTNGIWQYTTNAGGQWNSFGTPSAAASRLLTADGSTYVRFVPNANWNGTVNNGITFRAWDQTSGTAGNTADTSSNGGTTAFSSATASASVTVTSVNDAPAGANNTATAVQDNDYTFAAADLGFTDPNESAANTLSAVTITSIPGAGSLRLSGVAVTAGQSVSAANITAGNLKFTPAAGQSGSGYASFTFQVQDNGGTANGGVDLDQSANTMTVDVTSTYTVSGTVYHDVDGDADIAEGGTGTFRSVAVHVYLDDGDGVIEATDAFVASTTTNAAGAYSVSGLANATYWVLVDSRTIGNAADVAYNGGFGIGDVWAEQTYGDDSSTGALDLATRYGGRNQNVDSANNPSSSEHVARVGVSGGNVSAVNWGFSFNAIVETRGDNVDDDGAANRLQQGTLRQFLLNSNAISGVQTSNFSIGGGGLQTITTNVSALPTITDAVVLDATSQEGFAGTPLIILNGNGLAADALTLSADGSTIRGLIIRNFDGNGIRINAGSDNNVIQGNYIGALDENGNLAAAASNTEVGVSIAGANNTIGGTSAADRNVISANTEGGIAIAGASASGNLIVGNYIGTNAGGTLDLGNADDGIAITGGAQNNTIGGTAAGARNVISGNGDDGIDIDGAGTDGNVILGNYIGLNAAGNAALGNDSDGIVIGNSASGNIIGGSAAGAGNVISGNDTEGVRLNNNSTGTIVRGNLIGLNAAGTVAIGNDNDGVSINGGSSNNAIGGTGAGEGNIIAGNETGVQIAGVANGNAILGNSIYGNTDLGIDLGNDGVDVPDGATSVGQPNLRMDSAAIQSALLGGTSLTLTGYVGNAPSSVTFAGARVEFFLSDDDASGYGEGRTYLGFLIANGNSQFSGVLTVAGLNVGDKITATVTDAAGNTSEFSLNFTTVADPGAAPVNTVPGLQTINEDTATAIAGISVNDVNTNLTTVALGVGNGVLSVNLAGGASISAGANGTGALTLSGTQAQINAALATLSYQGSANFTGADTLTVVSTDTGALSDNDTVSINVVSVNDAPAGTNNTITAAEDVAYVFAATDFGFTDPNDSPANALSAVTVSTIPGAGSLTLSGVAVTAGQLISAANITAGNLRFTAGANTSGASYANFTFQIQDNGGTANGGVDLDASPTTITIDVTAVNDAPAGADNTVTALEDAAYTFIAANFGFSDANDNPSDGLAGVRIATLPSAGTLVLSGVAVSAGQVVSAANIGTGDLQLLAAANASGVGYASFTFQVVDNGGTANGGINMDGSANTMSVDVTAVDDAPIITNNTLTLAPGDTIVLSGVQLGATDVDNPAAALAFTVSGVTHGYFELVGAPGVPLTSFTQAQIAAGQVQFVHDASMSAPAYSLSVSDGTLSVGPSLANISFALPVPVVPGDEPPATPPLQPQPPTPVPDPMPSPEASDADSGDAQSGGQTQGEEADDVALAIPAQPQSPDSTATNSDSDAAKPLAQRIAWYSMQSPIATRIATAVNEMSLADLAIETLSPQQADFSSSTPANWSISSAYADGPSASEKGHGDLLPNLDSKQLGGMALSAGVVWWASRLSGIVGSLLASLPAWRQLDPLLVVSSKGRDDEHGDDVDFDAEADEIAMGMVLDGPAIIRKAAPRTLGVEVPSLQPAATP